MAAEEMKTGSNFNYIIDLLPYKSSFLFVDNLTAIDKDGVTGDYTLRPAAFFYEDHFPGNPITPGVIITEIMAQIGLVALGVYLLTTSEAEPGNVNPKHAFPLFTETAVSFFKMVLPGEKLMVISKKVYFRFGKLKCNILMQNGDGEIVAKGTFSGVIRNLTKEAAFYG